MRAYEGDTGCLPLWAVLAMCFGDLMLNALKFHLSL